MYDLFISYSSKDRPWAERLYFDLRRSFPSVVVFWDQVTIRAGSAWRNLLTNGNVHTKHLAVLWSDDARASNEVAAEIATFEAERRLAPANNQGAEFPFPFQGQPGGEIQSIQGFPALALYYDPTAPDRGVSKLDNVPQARKEWNRAIRMIGDAILSATGAHKVIAAVIATKTQQLALIDHFQDVVTSDPDCPTLNQFLREFGLDWPAVRGRYGASALDWRPFGGIETVVELLEDLRVKANSKLDSRFWFRWDHIDVTGSYGDPLKERLLKEPSVVIVDPISLYDAVTAPAFRGLKNYVENDQSVVVSLAPVGLTGIDQLARALRAQSVPLLEDYFEPRVPPVISTFARCSINVQRIDEIERFLRARLGVAHVRTKEAEAKAITGVAR